jgi:hypothetical protein
MAATIDIRAAAKELGGEPFGAKSIRCPGPNHSSKDRSLFVTFEDDGTFVTHSHARDSWQECRAHVKAQLRLPDDDRRDRHETSRRREIAPSRSVKARPFTSPDKMRGILRLAIPLVGTLGERFFRARGCAKPAGDAVRYLAPSEKYPWPTIVSVITDFVTAEPISLHFTMLNKDGTDKAPIEKPRRLLSGHRKAGGVIRLTDDADVERHLGLGEGIESCLAVTAALGSQASWLPIWSAIDAGNLEDLPVVAGIQRLTIYSDVDRKGTGQKAAQTLANRWHDAGREVFIAAPPAPPGGKRDWNE